MKNRRALVTGVAGQDGAYLAQSLLCSGWDVTGCVHRGSTSNLWRLKYLGIADKVKLIPLELLDDSDVADVIRSERPDCIFNLAAQSFVATSFKQPMLTSQIDAIGVLRLVEAVRTYSPETRFYQASTSEMFGKAQEVRQSETSPFHPRSPYGVAKLYGHWIVKNYREIYGLHLSSGILFNHESPLRGLEFVTRKITAHIALIKRGQLEVLQLGNLDAKRDWGHARDYVNGMICMTERDHGDDFVLATGVSTSVRDAVRLVSEFAGFDVVFEGTGVAEHAIDKRSGKVILRVIPEFFRPAEVEALIGDPSRASKELGWSAKTQVAELLQEMFIADMDRLARGEPLI